MRGVIGVVIAIALIFLILRIVASFAPPPHTDPSTPEELAALARNAAAAKAEQERQRSAAVDSALRMSAESTLRSWSRDPKSVHFDDEIVRKESLSTVCGTVDARNEFGGHDGKQRFLAYGTTIMLEKNAQQFARIWNRRCGSRQRASSSRRQS